MSSLKYSILSFVMIVFLLATISTTLIASATLSTQDMITSTTSATSTIDTDLTSITTTSTSTTSTSTDSNDDTSQNTTNTILGYVGAIIAILFYGSNYVVTKKYPTGDGVAFSWLMSNGIFFVGFLSLAITTQNRLYFDASGLIGGTIWGIGNLCVVPIIKTVGLGLGFLLWSGSNLIGGYLVGKIGLFGVEREVIESVGGNVMNIFGLVGGIVSLLLFFFIKPPAEKNEKMEKGHSEKESVSDHLEGMSSLEQHGHDEEKHEEEKQEKQQTTYGSTTTMENENTSLLGNSNRTMNQNEQDETSINQVTTTTRNNLKSSRILSHPTVLKLIALKDNKIFLRIVGIVLAILSGCLYAVNLTPFKLWVQRETYIHNKAPNPIDFAFSHLSGIYLLNSAVFIIYILFKKNTPQIWPNMILPSMICGVMWGIATLGLLYASSFLGFTVGYPLVAIGPSLVSTFWNVCVFREITGLRNLIILSCSLAFALIGVILLAVSRMI